MNDTLKKTLWLLLYAFMAGVTLSLFTQIQGFIKYAFSLLAIYIGIQYFRKFEGMWLRITFIGVALVFYFLAAIIFALYFYIKENPIALTGLA